MPRAYRTRASRPPLAEAAKRWLLDGEKSEQDAPGFGDYVDARYFRPRELWLEHGAELMREFIEAHPGQRPSAWWEFDCPPRTQRLKVSGSGQEGAGGGNGQAAHYFDCDPADPPHVESVPTFLKRLGLLLPGEEKRVPKRAWRPVRLDVDVDGDGWAPGFDDGDEAA